MDNILLRDTDSSSSSSSQVTASLARRSILDDVLRRRPNDVMPFCNIGITDERARDKQDQPAKMKRSAMPSERWLGDDKHKDDDHLLSTCETL